MPIVVLWHMFQFLLTYVILGNVLALFLLRLLRQSQIDRSCILFASLGLAPGIISLVLYFSFLILPGYSRWLYVTIVLVIFIALLMISWKQVPLLLHTYKSSFTMTRCSRTELTIKALVALSILASVLLMSYSATIFPAEGNDSLIHAYIGRMLAQDRSLEHFPMLSPLPDGFSTNVHYPPGVHLLYAWSYLLQGTTTSDIGVRLVAPMFVLFTLLLLWRWGDAHGRGDGLFAAFGIVTIPAYMHQAAFNSIDAMRIFFFFSAFFWVWQLTKSRSLPLLIITCIALALAPFMHMIGLFAIPVAIVSYCLFAPGRIVRRIGIAVFFASIACVIGGFDYFRRFVMYGTPMGPSLSIPWDISEQLALRGLSTPNEILFNGVLIIFTKYLYFGILPWLYLASMFLLLRKHWEEKPLFIFLTLCTVMTATLIWVSPSPAVPGWANYRYIMTIVPFLSLCSGMLLNTICGMSYIGECQGNRFLLAKLRRVDMRKFAVMLVLVLIIIMCVTRIQNLMWGKTGGASTCYGLQRVLLSDDEKLISSGSSAEYASVLFINENTPKTSIVLATEDALFFYYAKHTGISWRDRRLQPLYNSGTAEDAYNNLLALGIDYVQVCQRQKVYMIYRDSFLDRILNDRQMSNLVWESVVGVPTQVYKLQRAK